MDGFFRLLCNGQDPFRSAAALLDLIHTLWANVHPPAGRTDALAVILDAVSEAVGSDCSLDALSRKVGVSKYYLCHYFKAKTGMTVLDYLTWMRMDLAKKLLREGKEPVSQIAVSCGFNSPAYFSKCFKAAAGMTPSAFRKSNRS